MRLVVTAIVLAVSLLAICASGAGCDKFTTKLPGNVAGIVLNEGGQGQGFVSVHLVNQEPADEMVENASDSGNFMFKDVPPGSYMIKIFATGGKELPCDSKAFRVNVGKTLSQTVTLLSQEQAPSE